MPGDCERVHHEDEAQEIEELASVAEAVGPAEPECVLESSVDGLGVVAPAEQLSEAWVVGRDGPDVLGAVELPGSVLGVAVEADGDDAAAEGLGQAVVVVPPVPGLVGVAVGPDPGESGEEELPVSGEHTESDRGPADRGRHRDRSRTRIDWRIALGETQLDEVAKEILDGATRARAEREAGSPPCLGFGTNVSAEIVAYLPDEHVPERLPALLDSYLRRPHSPTLIIHLISAVLAVLILDTKNGMAMRRRLFWNPGDTATG